MCAEALFGGFAGEIHARLGQMLTRIGRNVGAASARNDQRDEQNESFQ